MGWKVVRIDFTRELSVECAFSENKGHKKLTNGIAYVVVDKFGNERFAGRTCVKKVDNPEAICLVPNYTNGCFLQKEVNTPTDKDNGLAQNSRQTGTKNSTSTISITESNLDRAVKYLTLRCELLSGYKKAEWPRMVAVFKQYKITKQLNEIDIKIALVAADGVYPKYVHLSMKRLLSFYTVYRLLQSLGNTEIGTVSDDVKKKDELFIQLYRKTSLSKEEISVLNQLLDKYGFKKLRAKPDLFQ